MKYGIITHYDVHNHGAVLQLNALVLALRKRYGVEAQALQFDKNYDFMGRELKAKYDREAQRGEEEFQRKFAEFLQGQKDFPENILLKRQHELQDLLAKSIAFKEEAQKLLSQAEKDLQADMVYLLNEAIRAVGVERGYACILNTDGNTCPFINPAMGDDVTNYVKEKLQLPISTTPEQ